jgi:hypothetical protein
MLDNEFDDLVKKGLQQYEGEVPADMWQRITAGKKKRRVVFIWRRYLIALVMLLFVIGPYYYNAEWNKKNIEGNIVTGTKTRAKSLNADTADTLNANKKLLLPGTDKINSVAFSKRSNNDHKPGKPIFSKRSVSKNNSSQTLIQDQTQESAQQQTSTHVNSDSTYADTADTLIQKNPTTTKPTATDDKDSANENEDHDKVSLQVFASPDVPFSNFYSSNSDYEKLLRNSVKMRLSYTIGAAISIAVSKNISLSSGIQYSHVNEKIAFEDSVQTLHNGVNHFNFINVPLIINYKTTWTSSFHTSLKAGILFNISSEYKGRMPDAFGELTDISHGVYERNTGVSIYTAINFSKPVANKINVFAEPYYRWQTKNIANDMQPFTRKISTAGLALGVELKLFKDEKK